MIVRYKRIFKEALKAKDKKVVDAFYDKKSAEGGMLETDGKILKKIGMGKQDIAIWKDGKVEIVAVSDVKSTDDILRYIKKSFPKNVLTNIDKYI